MRKQRMDGIPSEYRDLAPEKSLAIFDDMLTGSDEGRKWCIRAKISVDDPNKAMRDPVIYRCNLDPHHRTGTTWKAYPSYDLTVPILDSIEGVSHALRTTEYNDRDAQYDWIVDTLKLRKAVHYNFARLSFVRTLMSKRKLKTLVEDGIVTGWDDPRMPTVRGIMRRGLTVPALREFIVLLGPSKSVVTMDWTTIWAINKKHIDPVSARYTAVVKENAVPVKLIGGPAKPEAVDTLKHAKYDLGSKTVWRSENLTIDQEDAASFAEGEEILLMK
jgi:glutamyl/glutaminyl-tRNA synthetase